MNEALDAGTRSHQTRVSDLCVCMGRALNLHAGFIHILRYAGAYHDVGKTDISPEILNKPGPLTPEEKAIVKKHARRGFRQLSDREYATVRKVVVAHHEFRKNPYPRNGDRRNQSRPTPDRRANNDQIHLMGQILALCDMYDALISERAYKRASSRQEALQTIQKDFTGDANLIETLAQCTA